MDAQQFEFCYSISVKVFSNKSLHKFVSQQTTPLNIAAQLKHQQSQKNMKNKQEKNIFPEIRTLFLEKTLNYRRLGQLSGHFQC
jgi:hypothetical protein